MQSVFRPVWAGLPGLAIALVMLSWPASAEEAPALKERADRTPCLMGQPERFQCFALTREATAYSGPVRVSALLAPASDTDAHGEPILILPGGPGADPTILASGIVGSARDLNQTHPLVFIDQRGTGASSPAISCPDFQLNLTAEPTDAKWLHTCSVANFDLLKLNPAQFDPDQAARDIQAVRESLGIRQWTILASSWDSRVAVRLANLDRAHVVSLILRSPVPVDGPIYGPEFAEQRVNVLSRIESDCAAQVRCEKLFHPDERVPRLLRDLESVPSDVILKTDDGKALPYRLDGSELAAGLLAQASWSRARAVPLVATFFDVFLRQGTEIPAGIAMPFFALYKESATGSDAFKLLTPTCRAQYGAEPIEAVKARFGPEAGLSFAARIVQDCEIMDIGGPEQAAPTLLPPDLPTLVVLGRYDAQVPESAARRLVEGHPKAQLVVIANSGHDTSLSGCAKRLVDQFIANPDQQLDMSCAAEKLVFDTHVPLDN